MKLAFMFPGQGAQAVEMGKDVYENYSEAREVYKQVSNILGMDMCKLCFEADMETLSKTENTQIAIATMSLSILKVLKKYNIEANIVTGLSLGEYVALIYAGVLDIETGMKLLKQRGYLMEHFVPNENYAMVAVIGLDSTKVEEVCATVCNEQTIKNNFVVPANYNYSEQIVISGNEEAVDMCMEILKEKGAKKVVKLKTSGPFHTAKLQKASMEFAKYLEDIEFHKPKTYVAKNIDGSLYQKEDNIGKILEKHIISPVRFDKTIETMKKYADTFVEVGPGKALSGFVKREIEGANVFTINNAQSLENFLKCTN